MFRRTIRDEVAQVMQEKLRQIVSAQGPALFEFEGKKQLNVELRQAWPPPEENKPEGEILMFALESGVPRKLLQLSGKITAPLLFEELMRPFALSSSRIPYKQAIWAVKSWADALHESLPRERLSFGEPPLDRDAFLALKKPDKAPLPIIEARIKAMFGITLAPTVVGRRQEGYRSVRGSSLQYTFGRDADGREYLDWSHEHRFNMTGEGAGRIYEDGQEVDFYAQK